MNALLLPGSHMTSQIWNQLKMEMPEINQSEFVNYPHEVTGTSKSVEDIASWVYETYKHRSFDYLIGHSMGGLIALVLAATYRMPCKSVILIESNLRPAAEFYRNLLLLKHRPAFGDQVMDMIRAENPFYHDALKKTVKENFDYTRYVHKTEAIIFGIYGDRGVLDHPGRISDLNLDQNTIGRIRFRFVKDACHLPMIENPKGLAHSLLECIAESV
jgi:pimeloyl-ACP methyl ester carboxylesterase